MFTICNQKGVFVVCWFAFYAIYMFCIVCSLSQINVHQIPCEFEKLVNDFGLTR